MARFAPQGPPPRDSWGRVANGLLKLWVALFAVSCLVHSFAQGWATSVTGDLDSNASAVVGGMAELPCDISAPSKDDKTHLVLWYKPESEIPIYTLDLRDRLALTPTQFPPRDIRSRVTFFHNTSGMPYLLIKDVHAEDQGIYRCRVDFKRTRTRNRLVTLNVVVPPSVPTLLDEKGLDLDTRIGPYNEGSILFLSCEVKGGRPPPRVTWWRDSIMLDDSFEVASVESVRNDLLVQSLSRSDFNETYTCQASNNNITPPVSSSVTVDMNLKPLDIRILNERKPLVVNKHYLLNCQSTGSRPPPIIGWYKDEKRIKIPRPNETVSGDSNVTTCILRFKPTADDNGKYIWCRASNPIIPGSSIQDGWLLDIHYTPKVVIKPGELVKLDNIREGDDVYLDCIIMSNPAVLRVEWQFQGRTLVSNTSSGVFTNNKSMILQKVRRQNSGSYTCVATNEQGEGESDGIILQVKHPPFCHPNLNTVFKVAREETVKILCEVDAYPTDGVFFKWTSNQTSEGEEDVHLQFTSDSTKSILSYTPKSEKDFGNLYCWAGNDVGFQKMPCIFTIEPAGPPDPVNSCNITNQTQITINVHCASGYDGGLSQKFFFEIYDASNSELKFNLSSLKPSILISELRPGMNYIISVYASNRKGRSEAFSIPAETLKNAVVDSNGSEKLLTTILGIVIGIVVVLALVGIIILIVIKLKSSKRSKKKDYQPCEHADRSNVPLRKDVDDCLDNEEKSPDIICSTNEQEFPSVKVRCLQKWAYGSDVSCESCLRQQGIGSGVDSAPSCRYPLRKIQPLQEATQPDIQMQVNHAFRIGEKNYLGPCLPNTYNAQDELHPTFHYIEDVGNPISNRHESSV